MLEMMQEQESQIERLRGERDEIEPILSGLKRDIERLEASRARCDETIIKPSTLNPQSSTLKRGRGALKP
jgi:predicted RNase H-like nuclease (RuvC/YqgF family)